MKARTIFHGNSPKVYVRYAIIGVFVFLMVLFLFRRGDVQAENDASGVESCVVNVENGVENDVIGVESCAIGIEDEARGVREGERPCDRLWKKVMQDYRNRCQKRMAELPKGDRGNEMFSYDAFEPEYNCHIENRVGLPFEDGGKFVCGSFSHFRIASKCLVYSIGSNGVFDFEVEVKHELGCEVHTFDPTGDTTSFAKRAEERGINFHPIGLAGCDGNIKINNELCPVLSLSSVMKTLGHEGRHIDIFKIDCEGCEYESFKSIFADIRRKKYSIGQIQVELHGTDFDQHQVFFTDADSANFLIFHKERNHGGGLGYKAVEYSLISKDTAHSIFEHDVCMAQF
jgi:hypothetical protein